MSRLLNNLICALAFLVSASSFAAAPHYAIYIDAGSSSSKLHLYHEEMKEGFPIISDAFSGRNQTGLSAFAGNPDQAGASLQPILDSAVAWLKNAGIHPSDVSIHILATAGMRLLSEKQQAAIYKHVTDYIAAHYPMPVSEARTISGQTEGIDGWVSINYLLQNFHTRNPTVGVIDMGGASTQLTFETTDHSHVNDELNVTVLGYTYHLFSKSFLGLGQNEARAAMNADSNPENCYPQHYPLNQSFSGNFSLPLCHAQYAAVIDASHVKENIPPLNHQPFTAVSGAWFVFHFFGAEKTPDESSFNEKIQPVCSQTWDTLKKNYPQENEKYLASYCADAAYLGQLFYGTYHLDGSQLTVTSQINQTSPDWVLGAYLLNTTHENMK